MRKNNKYVEVTVNFPGETVARDITHRFCVNMASERKSIALTKELFGLRASGYPFSGHTVRKTKEPGLVGVNKHE